MGLGRYSLKGRRRDAGAPEDVIDDIMGPKKPRAKYGRGHMLENKYEWLNNIALKCLL